MGLGKLGAFGKTNVLDVTGSLIKQHQEGLVAADTARRNRLIDELRVREEKRAEMKFNMEKADYDRDREMLDFDELAKQSGSPLLAEQFLKFGKSSGIVVERGGKRLIMRKDARNSIKDFREWGAGRPQEIYNARIADLDANIATLEEDLKGANEKDGEADQIRNQLNRLKNERKNLAMAEPEIQKAEAAARNKKKVEGELKTPEEKEKEKLENDVLRADARSKDALARRRNVEADALEGGSKLMTPANSDKLQKSANNVYAGRYFPVRPPGDPRTPGASGAGELDTSLGGKKDGDVRVGLPTLPKGMKPGTAEFRQYVRKNDPEMYVRMKEHEDRTAEVFQTHKGRISHDQAAEIALQELENERMARNSTSTPSTTAAPAAAQPQKKLVPPAGMTDERANYLLRLAEEYVKQGRSPEEVLEVLKKQGFREE